MDSISILEKLVAFDSVSSKSNLPIISWIEEYLASFGVPSTRVPNQTGDKASLYATIGPSDQSGYVLSGHTDVVPVEGQDWSSDPFMLELRDGLAFGRGTCDMKGFLACVLSALPAMQSARLKIPFILVFSYDEEVGCTGVRPLLAEMSQWPVLPRGCIVGEPTSMDVVIGHKEKLSKRVVVTGLTGHSALAPKAVNAAEYAARLVTAISDIGRRLATSGPRDDLYDVPHTTAHVGRFSAGTQLNIVPGHAEFDFEFRAVAADSTSALMAEVEDFARELEKQMQQIYKESRIEFLAYSEIPGLDTGAGDELVAMVKHIAGRNSHGKVAFSTEAGLFDQMAGVTTIVCGPGSIAEAHKADEYISIDQLNSCDKFLLALIDHCSA